VRSTVSADRLSEAERSALIRRAKHARAHLDGAIQLFSRSDLSAEESAQLAAYRTFVDKTYHSLFANEKSLPWLMFVRCIDHASRIAKAVDTPQLELDPMRAGEARKYFRESYPEFERKIDDELLLAAVRAWREGRSQWVAVRKALRRFVNAPPDEKSLARMWRDFPHLSR
jgi:hypothetical protein